MNNRSDYTEYAPPFGRGKIRKPVLLLTAQFFTPARQKKCPGKKLLLGFFKKIRFKLQMYSVGLLNFFLQIQDQERIGLYSK